MGLFRPGVLWIKQTNKQTGGSSAKANRAWYYSLRYHAATSLTGLWMPRRFSQLYWQDRRWISSRRDRQEPVNFKSFAELHLTMEVLIWMPTGASKSSHEVLSQTIFDIGRSFLAQLVARIFYSRSSKQLRVHYSARLSTELSSSVKQCRSAIEHDLSIEDSTFSQQRFRVFVAHRHCLASQPVHVMVPSRVGTGFQMRHCHSLRPCQTSILHNKLENDLISLTRGQQTICNKPA